MIMVHRSCGRRSLAKEKSSRTPGILQWHFMLLGSGNCLNKVLDLLLYGVDIKMFNFLDRVKLGLCTFMHR